MENLYGVNPLEVDIYSDITYITDKNLCLINDYPKTNIDEQKSIIYVNANEEIDNHIDNLKNSDYVSIYKIGETLINFINYNFPEPNNKIKIIPDYKKYEKTYNDLSEMNIVFEIHYQIIYSVLKKAKFYYEDYDEMIEPTHPYNEDFNLENIISLQNHLKEFINIAINDTSYFDLNFIEILIDNDLFESPFRIIKNYITVNKIFLEFSDIIDKLKKEYDKNYINHHMTTYCCTSVNSFFTCELLELCKSGYIIKKCENCGKYFIPYNRSDTIYCDNTSPQDNARTCKEYGTQRLWYDKLKNNEAMKLCRNIHSAKQMIAKRRIDIPEYQKNFEEFKIQSKQWKSDVKSGKKTEEEFITWLYEVKNKRYN